MEYKIFPSFIKGLDEEKGIVETIFAVFGNQDEGNDILMPGSFKKTISENGQKVRVLDQHNTDSIMRSIGKPVEIMEIGRDELPEETKAKFPDASGGVKAKVQFFMDTPEGKGAFIRIKEGGIDEWSFGYDVSDRAYVKVDGQQIRRIKQLKLYEFSPVLWGMNPATSTISAKSKQETKAVTEFQDLSFADRDTNWDGAEAEENVRVWAGGGEDLAETDWPEYRKAFFWYDADDPEKIESYKLGYADVVDGELIAIPRGIFAVAAALQGARGGVDIPADDADEIKNQVSRYYAKMAEEFDDDSIIPPWDKQDEHPEDDEEEHEEMSLNRKEHGDMLLGNVLTGKLYLVANSMLDSLLSYGGLDRSEHRTAKGVIDSQINGIAGEMGELANVDISYYVYPGDMGYYGLDPNAQLKVGRTLSAANAQKVQAALVNLQEVLMAAGLLEAIEETAATHEDEEEDHKSFDINWVKLIELEEAEMM